PEFLNSLKKLREFEDLVDGLGIARDSDANPPGTLQSLQNMVASANLPASIKVSYCLLPGPNQAGNLETLCLQSVRTIPLMACTEQFATCASAIGVPLGWPTDRDKSLFQAFTAMAAEPQIPPGYVAYKNVWPFTAPIFDPIKSFLLGL